MNGYVNRNGQEFLWIGKRSDVKPTFPGMLDHLVAGGLVCKGSTASCSSNNNNNNDTKCLGKK